MKRVTLLLFILFAFARADWSDEYSKKHPSNSSQAEKTLEECEALQDSVKVKTCLSKVDELTQSAVPEEEAFFYDEQTTVIISGDETTRTVTTIKSRSGKQIAKAIDGVKGAIYFSIGFSLVMSLISFIVISNSN